MREYVGGGALLDDPAEVEDGNALAGLRHEPEVVADEHDGQRPFLAQREQEIEDLGLNGHVEGGGRLVGDDEIRFRAERRREHHPLLHAARQLVRMALHDVGGVRQAKVPKEALRPLPGIRSGGDAVATHDALELAADGEEWIQGFRGVLEHHADAPAAQTAHFGFALRGEILAVVENSAAGNAPVPRHQLHDRAARLACVRRG